MNKNLIDEVMTLPANERVAFAELILESIDHEDIEIKDVWMKEVENRINSVKEGKSKLIDFDSKYNED